MNSAFASRVRDLSRDDPGRLAQLLFLWIGAPAALLLCVLIGPFEAADEPAHYLRAVAIAEGHVLPVVSPPGAPKKAAGAYLDSDAAFLAQDSVNHRGEGKTYSIAEIRSENRLPPSVKRNFAEHSNTAIYPPLLYVLSSAAVFIASGLGLPVLWWLYLGRLANAVAAILITQAALRRAGDASLLLFACAMLPISLFQLATLSADALLFPLFIAFAVMLLRIQRGEARRRGETLLLAGATLFVCAGKVAYLPLAILPPLAGRLADKRWSSRALLLLGAAALSLLVWLAWALAVQDKVFSIRLNIEINPRQQLHGLISHPIASAIFFIRQMAVLTPKLVIGAVGTRLGWGDLHLPFWLIYPLPILLVASALPATNPDQRFKFVTWAAIGGALVCYCAIFLLIYLQYNAVGAVQIEGVNGRYFTPLAILALSQVPRLKAGKERMRYAWTTAAGCALASTLVTLFWVHQQYW